MKVRALCAAGLVATAAVPATASAGNSIRNRLHRADLALNRAQDAADEGNDAKVVSSLRGANRQTSLALKATLRLVAHDRPGADAALADTTDQLDSNAQVAMDLLDGASGDVIGAVNSVLAATDTGRGAVLTAIQGLGDLEPDWTDALTRLADDAVGDIATAADDYDGLGGDAKDTLTTFVSHEIDAAGAVVTAIDKVAADGDADIDYDALDALASGAADAADALGSVGALSAANKSTVDDVVAKLGTLGDAVTALVDAAGPSGGDWWGDPSAYGDPSYDDGYANGFSDAFAGWGWFPRGDGYRGWHDFGFGPPQHP